MTVEDLDFNYYDKAEESASDAIKLYENGKLPQAIAKMDRALEINPANSNWRFNKALMLDSANRFEDAITEYETTLQLAPDDLEILNCLAVDYTRTGRYDEAIKLFEYMEKLDTKFEPAYCNRIITYTETEQHELAEQMFYLAQQISPDCPLCYYNIGNSLFIRGQYKKAARCWLKTAQLEPEHPQINYRIAQAHWSAGDVNLARRHFLAELRKNPGDLDVIIDFGILLLEANCVEAAKEKFNRALELNPDCAQATFFLGEIALDCSDRARAVDLFREAAQQDPGLTGPNYRLAQCCLAAGRPENARNHLLVEMRLSPENAEVQLVMGLSFMETASQQARNGTDSRANLDYAALCFRRAAELHFQGIDKNDRKGLHAGLPAYYLGCVSADAGKLCQAAEYLQVALDLRGPDTKILTDLAELLLKMGQTEKADRLMQVASEPGKSSRLKTLRLKTRLLNAAKKLPQPLRTRP
jgi:tetratricopeptide (TPR) repeat protein